MTTFTVATNEYRGGGNPERTEYHPCVACDKRRVDAILELGRLLARDLQERHQLVEPGQDRGAEARGEAGPPRVVRDRVVRHNDVAVRER